MSTRYRELTAVFGNFLDDNDFHTRISMDRAGDVKSIFNSKMIPVDDKVDATVEVAAVKVTRMRDALRRACNAVISMRNSTAATPVDVGTLTGEEEERLAWKFLIGALDADRAATRAVLEAELLRVAVDLHYSTARPELCDMFVHLSATEMFFIDGDSLFMAALSPTCVDWDLIQPLHVMFNAQKILQDLQQRGARFHVVFFEKSLWVWERAPKKLFMRENFRKALISASEGNPESGLTVSTFPSYHSEEFDAYLQLWEPEFLLMTDGEQLDALTPLQQLFVSHDVESGADYSLTQHAQNSPNVSDGPSATYRSLVEDDAVGSKAALYYRCMLLWAATRRLKVAYSSRIIYRENAMIVFTVRVDGSAFERAVVIEPEVRVLAQSMEHDVQLPVLSTESKEFLKEKISFRERILYAALHAYLYAETRTEAQRQMCQALLITVYVTGLLSNTSRAQYAEPNAVLSEMLSDLAPYFLAALRFADCAIGRGQEFDLIDGHLFAAVARQLRATAAKELLDEDGVEDVVGAWNAIANEDGTDIVDSPLAQLPEIVPCEISPLPPHPLYAHEMVDKLSKVFGIETHKVEKPFPSGFGAANALAGWDITTPFDRFNDVIDAEGAALAKSMMTEKEAKKAQEYNTKFVRNAFQQAQTMGIGTFAAQELAIVCSENEDDDDGNGGGGGGQKKKSSKAHAGQRNKKTRSHEDEIRESGNVKSAAAAVADWHKQLDQFLRNTDLSNDRVTNEDRAQAVDMLKKSIQRVGEANLGKHFDPGCTISDTESGVPMKLAMWRVLVSASKLREVEFALTLMEPAAKDKEVAAKGKNAQKEAPVLFGFAIIDRVVAGELAPGQLEPLQKARPDMTSAEVAAYLRWTYLSYVETHIQMKLRCRVVKLLLDTWRGERERARLAQETPSISVSIPLFLYCHHSVLSVIRDEGLQISEKDLEIVRSALAHFDFAEDYYRKIDQAITKWQNKAPEALSTSLIPPQKQLHETPEFLQLLHMGHLLERPFMRKRDYRVAFNPDNWQRELLDIVDSHGSAVVCAPTSAGKTFISYYCMFNALRRSNTRVVVYLAPARALINQAVADVCARYGSKKYKNPGTNIYGVLGGADYHQFHDCCQVLLTVPETFETMLLSAKYTEWVDRIDYVILDEIHSMENNGNGDVWERILALLPCPFVALSATLGETQQLCDWLNRTQSRLRISNSASPTGSVASGGGKSRDYNVHLLPSEGRSIQRWNDIKKYIYLPPPGTVIPVKKLTASYEHRFIRDLHPLSILTTDQLRRGFPPDISLVPSEVVALYTKMLETFKRVVWPKWSAVPLVHAMDDQLALLEPAKYFETETYITQERARKYEADVKNAFAYWVFLSYESDEHLDELDDDQLDEFNATMKTTTDGILHSFAQQLAEDESALENHAAAAIEKRRALQRQQHAEKEKTESLEAAATTVRDDMNLKDGLETQSTPFPGSRQFIRNNIMGVLREILARDMGPTIVFSFESEDCGDLAKWAVEQLEEAEARFRKSEEFAIYKAKMERNAAAQVTRRKQRESTLKQKRLTKDDDGNKERVDRDISDAEGQEETFDIPDVLPEFTFIGDKCTVDPMVVSSLLKDCEEEGEDLLLRALRRGIGLHHAGVRGKLRGHVERLFRGRHCGVIFSTETLALGIHSPCRSVVLAGDHILLNPTQFRQMMGRAGRRGLDYLGHLIFIGISMRRIKRLMTSSMTVIKGNVQMDPVSQLRLLQLYDYNTHRRLKNEVQWKAYVMKLAERLFTNPLFFQGRAAVAGGNMEGLTIEYLQMLLGYFQREGLHYNEYTSSLGSLLVDVMYVFREAHVGNEGFAFIKMLTSGVFNQASYPPAHNKNLNSGVTDEPIVELLAYLFSTHQTCGVPLEVHRSVLLDPAVSAVWKGKTGSTHHRVVLAPINLCSPVKALDNTDFLGTLSSFYNYLADKLEASASGALRLPYMRSDKKQCIFAKEDAELPLVDKLKETMVLFKARSPFVAISGCGDRFTSLDDITFTLRDGLFCDRRMLPILDLADGWRHDGAQILINACLADFLRVKAQIDPTRKNYRFTMLEELNGLSQSLSYAVLNKVEKIMSNLGGLVRRAKLPPAKVLLAIMPESEEDGNDRAGAPRLLEVAERLNSLQMQIQKRFTDELFAAKMAKWASEKAAKRNE